MKRDEDAAKQQDDDGSNFEKIEITEEVSKSTDKVREIAESVPDEIEDESPFSPNNLLNHATKNEMPDISTKLLMSYKLLSKADEDVSTTHLEQVYSIAETCLRILQKYEKTDAKKAVFDMCLATLTQTQSEEGLEDLKQIMEAME
jgi:hypothetical protein